MLSPYAYPTSAPSPFPPRGRATNIREVSCAWRDGRPAKNKAHGGGGASYWTDGYNLYSYDLKIGYTDETGHKIVLEYTSRGQFVSMTTSCHVGSGRSVADKVVFP